MSVLSFCHIYFFSSFFLKDHVLQLCPLSQSLPGHQCLVFYFYFLFLWTPCTLPCWGEELGRAMLGPSGRELAVSPQGLIQHQHLRGWVDHVGLWPGHPACPCPADVWSCAYECDVNTGALPDRVGAPTAWPGPALLWERCRAPQAELLPWAGLLVEHLQAVLQTTLKQLTQLICAYLLPSQLCCHSDTCGIQRLPILEPRKCESITCDLLGKWAYPVQLQEYFL